MEGGPLLLRGLIVPGLNEACGRDPGQSVFPLAAGHTEATKQSCRGQQRWFLPPSSARTAVLSVLLPITRGNPRQPLRLLRGLPLPSCRDVGCPLASGLDPVAPSSHSPLTGTQEHLLLEHLLWARHSVHRGERGSCMIPDLARLMAQLAIVPAQSCWPGLSFAQAGAQEAGALCLGHCSSPWPSLSSPPHRRHGLRGRTVSAPLKRQGVHPRPQGTLPPATSMNID